MRFYATRSPRIIVAVFTSPIVGPNIYEIGLYQCTRYVFHALVKHRSEFEGSHLKGHLHIHNSGYHKMKILLGS